VPEGLLPPAGAFIEMVSNGVEGFEIQHLAGGCGGCGCDPVDAEDFSRVLTADVREDMVLGFVLLHADGLRHAMKKVHHRCGVEQKGVLVDHQIRLGAPVQIDPDLQRVGYVSAPGLRQAVEIEKEIFFRERKVLLKVNIPGERPSCDGQHDFVGAEADRPDGCGAKSKHGSLTLASAGFALHVADVVAKQFVEVEYVLVGTVQENAQRFPPQL